MNKFMRQWLQRARPGRVVLHGRQRGQSLIIIVFAFIGLLALVGLAVDLGLVYVERVRIARAADAAALAGVSELPLEAAAHARALMYLQENGYDYTNLNKVRVVINPGASDEQVIEMVGNEMLTTTIVIDTAFAREPDPAPGNPPMVNTSSRIRVKVIQQVPMTFLQFVGFRRFPVEATAEAENISNLDVVIVYDRSGSMEFDTVCYGCWDPYYPSGTQAAVCSNLDGCLYPLRWSQSGPTTPADHCAGWVSGDSFNCGSYSATGAPSGYVKNNCNYRSGSSPSYKYYTVIEAEEYSSWERAAGYQDWSTTPYKTFWAIQRNVDNYFDKIWDGSKWIPSPVGATGRDSRGGYVSHHPFAAALELGGFKGSLGVRCTWSDLTNGQYCRRKWPNGSDVEGGPFYAPRLDYKFTAPASTNYYFWIRGQGGGWTGNETSIFWGLGQVPYGQEPGFLQGPNYDGARSDRWSWRRLSKGESGTGGDSVALTAGQTYVLNLWGGGAGFSVDRIIITTDSSNPLPSAMSATSVTANNGRTDDVCDRCDPRFAGRDGGFLPSGSDWWLPDCDYGPEDQRDQRQDDIYSGELPIRDALDGAERFISRMDFRLDQIGYVRYSDSSSIANELECLRRRSPENLGDPDCDPSWYQGYPNPYAGGTPADPDCGCFSRVITNTVLYQLNNTRASGGTNIADAIANGIDVLSTGGAHFGRPGAAHIMVLMTDGEANQGGGCGAPASLWPEDNEPAKDCVIYYAKEARDNGIVIYTIALGWGADSELMKAVADMTGGEYREAKPVTPESLDAIFNELFERIFLRLVQ